MADNFDKSAILESFIDEVSAYLPEIEADLDRLQQSPGDANALEESYRRAHTIGGSAAMMDFGGLAKVAQGMEETLGNALDHHRSLDPATVALLRRSYGRLARMLDLIRSQGDDSALAQEDAADRSAWRGPSSSASVGAAAGMGSSSGRMPVPGGSSPGAPSGPITAAPGVQIPEWLAAFAGPTGATNDPAPLGPMPPTEREENLPGTGPSTAQAGGDPRLNPSLAGFDVADMGTAALPTIPHPGASAPRGAPLGAPAAAAPAWGTSQPGRMPVAGEARGGEARGGALSALEEVRADSDALRRQVATLRDIVATLREAAQTVDGERTEMGAFLDGSADALDRLEEWAGRQMGLDLRNSPEAVRRYLPLSVIWVTTARLQRLEGLLHSSGRSLSATQEQIDEALNELRGALDTFGRMYASVASAGGDPENGFSATVAQFSWAPPVEEVAAAETALSPAARAELEREVRERLRRELEDEVRDEVAAEMRQREEQRLRHELEIQVRRQLLSELAPGLGASSVTALEGGLQIPLADRAPRPVQVTSEQSPEAIAVFRDEAEEHLESITEGIRRLERMPGDIDTLRSIRRAMHTLKGAAGMMGFGAVQDLAHASENLLERLAEGTITFSPAVLSLIFDTSETLDQLVSGGIGRPEDQQRAVLPLIRRYGAITGEPLSPAPSMSGGATQVAARGADAPTSPSTSPTLSVRLQLSKLDDLVNIFGELIINRSILSERVDRLAHLVGDTAQVSERLRDVGGELETGFEAATLPSGRPGAGVPNPDGSTKPSGAGWGGSGLRLFGRGGQSKTPDHAREFDELELDRYTEFHRLSRGLSEGVADVNTLSREMETLIHEIQTAFSRENRLSSDFQDRLLKARLVPLQSLVPRLYRAARASALREGKEIEFFVDGGGTEVDRKVFEEVEGPLLHLVRNAVNHGIERPEVRARAGKPRAGKIVVSAAYEGNQVAITVRDDGAGVDPERIRAAAIARGLIDRRTQLSEKEAIDLMFRPGMTTAGTVTEESGRGVGLDVVRDAVNRLRGTVEVESAVGRGTTFTLKLPISLQIARAVLVRVGAQTWAVPMVVVAQIGRLEYYPRVPGAVPLLDVRGEHYLVVHLAGYLGLAQGAVNDRTPVLLINAGRQHVALLVDDIVSQQEIVSKPLGPHLRDVRGVSGATVLGNGQVVLILDLLEILAQPPREGITLPEPGTMPREQMPTGPLPESALPANVTAWRARGSPPSGASRPAAAANEVSGASSPSAPFVVTPRNGATSSPGRATYAPDGKQSYILVVDDSPSVRRVVTMMLKAHGWAVQTARDGIEALDVLARERPAAVLLDIEMPRMDGYELMATIRSQEQYRTLPLLILTSRAATKHQQRALQLGADDYIVKPYQDDDLLNRIAALVQASEQ